MAAPRFATTLLLATLCATFVVELAGAAPGNNAALLRLGALPDSGGLQGQYWRLFTFGLLHWNLMHLVLNAACLLIAGAILERRIDSWQVTTLFVAASMISGVAILFKHHFWPGDGVTVGASGAVFGLLGAAVVLVQRVPLANPAYRIGLWTVLATGLAVSLLPGISMVGHIAGLSIGAPAGLMLRAKHVPKAAVTGIIPLAPSTRAAAQEKNP